MNKVKKEYKGNVENIACSKRDLLLILVKGSQLAAKSSR